MRVLFVNPQPEALPVARAVRREGGVADAVRDTDGGLSRAAKGDYDAIVLGVPVEVRPAVEAVRRWRRRRSDTPIVALTPRRDVTQTVRIIDGGADDCVAAPFSADELFARLRAVTRRRPPRPTLVRIGDLEIDANTRSVRRNGAAIPLTRLQYALLQFLVLHRGEVVTRSMMLEHLYGDAIEPESNVLDVHIRNLRSKIDKSGEPSLIVTRWGEGYLLPAEEPQSDGAHPRGSKTHPAA